MSKLLMDPATFRAHFDQSSGRLQRIGYACSRCPTGKTPLIVKATVRGLLVCSNIGGCCGTDNDKRGVVTSQGDGWDFDLELNQGENFQATGWVGCERPPATSFDACAFGATKAGNYGTVEEYNLQDCLGGLKGTGVFCRINARLYRLASSITFQLQFSIDPIVFGAAQYTIFSATVQQTSQWQGECFPYNIAINNAHTCDGSGYYPYSCIGDGTVVLQKLA